MRKPVERQDRPSSEPGEERSLEPWKAGRHDQDKSVIPARILNEFVYCPRLAYL